MRHRSSLILFLLAVVLVGTVVLAAGMGQIQIPPLEVARILLERFSGSAPLPGAGAMHPTIVWDVRLPRILTSVMVGGGLALCGVVFQAILRNPLADPYTLGVSSGAAFGASLALLANLRFLGQMSVPLFAFAGALTALVAVFALAGRDGEFGSTSLILAGVIVAAILSAGIGFIKHLADEHVSAIIFWLMGSFASRTWTDAALAGASVLFAGGVALFFSRDLNVMTLGERAAGSLGVDGPRTRLILLSVASLATAVCVSVSGVIGFIGLIVPHLSRLVLGPDNRALLPAAFLSGAVLLLAADTVSRAVLPSEVPIGVLTALAGGPVFCVLFQRRHQGGRHG